ncbi:hypothetical protein RM572_07255 [Streptomyces sp. DSM 42041]|uniref:Uncharacterized protein n=1 Tax=Streptomyces hazeniae TaxID=3075538 RepID=A0ABU2NNL7_9ACTN|nr:hypothetical protein [Streptomyces sp. DSM 42041]MDT0378575.1 hypothetical protein [Streptomyces sp. DSM 42041]
MEDQPARPADPPAAPAAAQQEPEPETTPEAGSTAGDADAPAPGPTTAPDDPPASAPGAPALADAPATPGADAPEEPAPRRPRGRTTLLLAAAALLGVVAGVATGYTVQAERPPTPLPPLSQAQLSYPDKHVPADEWEPVPAKHDRRVRTDGDLRKLLVKKPKGAREFSFLPITDGWVTPADYARGFEQPGSMFDSLLEMNVRRIAATEWEHGDQVTSVVLVQFHDQSARSAPGHAWSQGSYMVGDDYAGNGGHPIEGSDDGRYWVYDTPFREPGYLPVYGARALACRGDIVLDIHITDTGPIGSDEIRDIAERQLERL